MPFMQGAMFVSITAGTTWPGTSRAGFLNRLALTPLRGEALLLGQLGGAVVLAVVQAVVFMLVADWRLGIDFASGVGGVVVLLLLSLRSRSRSRASAGSWRCGSVAAKRSRGSSRCCS